MPILSSELLEKAKRIPAVARVNIDAIPEKLLLPFDARAQYISTWRDFLVSGRGVTVV